MKWWAPAIGVALLVGCGGGSPATNDVLVEDGLAVVDAWVRPTPPSLDDAAFYVTIENRDAPDDRLVGASSDRCTLVTPHATVVTDDIARMSEVDDDLLGLRPGERVTMEPNGVHLMCLGLVDPLVEGEVVDIVLRFAGHDPITVPVVVEQR